MYITVPVAGTVLVTVNDVTAPLFANVFVVTTGVPGAPKILGSVNPVFDSAT